VTAPTRDAVRWNLQVRGLAQRVGQEEQRSQTMSTVLQARHETARNSIHNVR
jgi:hypothetical protein